MQSGKVGNVRYYVKNGLTYVRSSANSAVTNPRSSAQMTQRLHWASCSALWKVIKPYLTGAFPGKERNQSDYNAFMKVNQGNGIFLTKEQKQNGNTIIFPVIVSLGDLEPIDGTIASNVLKTDLSLGSLTMSADTTITDFSAAIVSNNIGFDYDDQITFCQYQQKVTKSGMFKVSPVYTKITLCRDDDRKVWAVAGQDGFRTVSGNLGTGTLPAGCYGYIHSRKDSKLQVSTCELLSNNDTVLEPYITDAQFNIASLSYGKSESLYLSPDSNGSTTAPSGNSTPSGGGSTPTPGGGDGGF